MRALEGVIRNAGKNVSGAVQTRIYNQLKDMIYDNDDHIRSSSAGILGFVSQVSKSL